MVRVREVMKTHWKYAALPVFCASLLTVHIGQTAPFNILLYTLIVVFSYVTAIMDIKTRKIPNRLVLAMFAAWIIMITPYLFYDTSRAIELLKDSALGCAIGGGMFLFVYLISRKGLGGGDVKFMAAAGLYLGFGGVMAAMLSGTILAALTGVVLIILKRIGRKDAIPLAPFLFIGIFLTVFFLKRGELY